MDNALILGALRTHLLAQAAVTALVGQRIHVSKADVGGMMPSIAFTEAGGEGYLNPKHFQANVNLEIWSSVSWAQAYAIQAAASAALDGWTFEDGLPAPLLTVDGKAPSQVNDGTYFHLQQSLDVLSNGA